MKPSCCDPTARKSGYQRGGMVPRLPWFPVELQSWYRKLNPGAWILNVEARCLRYARGARKRRMECLRE